MDHLEPKLIEIRKWRREDTLDLAELFLEARRQAFPWMPKDQFKLDDFAAETEGELIWVAVVDSLPVGFVSVWMPDNFIHHLYIHPKLQSSGIGKRLLQEALLQIGRPARLKCVIQNFRACKFYELNGWKIERTVDEGPMGPYHTYVLS